MFNYRKKKRTGKFYILKKLVGYKVMVEYKCDKYYKECFVKKTKKYFEATSKDLRKLGL